MSQSEVTMEQYEYVPMSVPFNKTSLGYGFGEGVGINASGFVRGYVVIHDYSPNQVDVTVFSDTGVRRLAPNSWRQAVVELVKGNSVLTSKTVKKHEPYIISMQSRESFLGSATLNLPYPVDEIPINIRITVSSVGIFPEGIVPGKTQKATVPISVRKVTAP